MHLTFWFALFWNWPCESNGVASGNTASPSCVSPGGTHFQGDSGFIGLRSSDGFWFERQNWTSCWLPEAVGRASASPWALPLRCARSHNTCYCSDRNHGVRKGKLVPWNSGTQYGGRQRRKQQIQNVRQVKGLGSERISGKVGKRATVAWVGISAAASCPAQEAPSLSTERGL